MTTNCQDLVFQCKKHTSSQKNFTRDDHIKFMLDEDLTALNFYTRSKPALGCTIYNPPESSRYKGDVEDFNTFSKNLCKLTSEGKYQQVVMARDINLSKTK